MPFLFCKYKLPTFFCISIFTIHFFSTTRHLAVLVQGRHLQACCDCYGWERIRSSSSSSSCHCIAIGAFIFYSSISIHSDTMGGRGGGRKGSAANFSAVLPACRRLLPFVRRTSWGACWAAVVPAFVHFSFDFSVHGTSFLFSLFYSSGWLRAHSSYDCCRYILFIHHSPSYRGGVLQMLFLMSTTLFSISTVRARIAFHFISI